MLVIDGAVLASVDVDTVFFVAMVCVQLLHIGKRRLVFVGHVFIDLLRIFVEKLDDEKRHFVVFAAAIYRLYQFAPNGWQTKFEIVLVGAFQVVHQRVERNVVDIRLHAKQFVIDNGKKVGVCTRLTSHTCATVWSPKPSGRAKRLNTCSDSWLPQIRSLILSEAMYIVDELKSFISGFWL